MMVSVQDIAFAVIAIATIVIAVSIVLLLRRASRLMDKATKTMRVLNQLAPSLERLIDEAQKEIATVRTITARFACIGERVEGLTEEVVLTLEAILHPIGRFSKTLGVLKAVIAGAVTGAAVLRRERGASAEPPEHDSSPPGRAIADKGGAA